jgi:hypothetical protein
LEGIELCRRSPETNFQYSWRPMDALSSGMWSIVCGWIDIMLR